MSKVVFVRDSLNSSRQPLNDKVTFLRIVLDASPERPYNSHALLCTLTCDVESRTRFAQSLANSPIFPGIHLTSFITFCKADDKTLSTVVVQKQEHDSRDFRLLELDTNQRFKSKPRLAFGSNSEAFRLRASGHVQT
jgi:hypothetical protein